MGAVPSTVGERAVGKAKRNQYTTAERTVRNCRQMAPRGKTKLVTIIIIVFNFLALVTADRWCHVYDHHRRLVHLCPRGASGS
ncbi:unnamed protein product [Ixodes pacificus]